MNRQRPRSALPAAEAGLAGFSEVTQSWFAKRFGTATRAQQLAWPHILRGSSTLLMSETGSGKTLAAFLVALDRLMFDSSPRAPGVKVVYISPLKALAVDVEKNLQQPLDELLRTAAASGTPVSPPSLALRSGDTSARARRLHQRSPPDVLLTTPESLYLILTSNARRMLETVECIIVDEIHALCGNKRGAHLTLSLERLEALRTRPTPLQRIGLSATAHPSDGVARFLVGREPSGAPRAVTQVVVPSAKRLCLRVEAPLFGQGRELPKADRPEKGPIDGEEGWQLAHEKFLALIRRHHTTLLFVNSRRQAERLAGALNDEAGEEVALAHHGSLALDKRTRVEARLKSGTLPAIVATGSLELGIDMDAVDLVIAVEPPPSVASALQRFGRANHQVGGTSKAILFPKFQAELPTAATVTARSLAGLVEATHPPQNPLDVLAQHVVSHVACAPLRSDELYALVRRAEPFATLSPDLFERVLTMLSGGYPGEALTAFRPRITYDRNQSELRPRRSSKLLATANAGTIVDRGLYGVFLAGSDPPARVGELDEEMVFELRVGEVFVLGASSWRVDSITADRVLVSPAPGQPGRMPFWRGERPPRPFDFGAATGELLRELTSLDADAALQLLQEAHALTPAAASAFLSLLEDQAARGLVPHDRRIVVESVIDESGERIVVLSPFGGRVHAPWALAVTTWFERRYRLRLDALWTDEGMVFRMPEADLELDAHTFVPSQHEVTALVREGLASSALFAATFRECAARALLLPKRRPGERVPLWLQRRRAQDLLYAASQLPDFPIVLEAYRECLHDTFDLPNLIEILQGVEQGRIEVVPYVGSGPSPFATNVLFSFVGNFVYAGDAPLGERRAQALALDPEQLGELLGEPSFAAVLDPDAIEAVVAQASQPSRPLRDEDDLHDWLLQQSALNEDAVRALACAPGSVSVAHWLDQLVHERRAIALDSPRGRLWVAIENAGRYASALGVSLPPHVPSALQGPARNASADVALAFARSHGPFVASDLIAHFGQHCDWQACLDTLVSERTLLKARFRAQSTAEEYLHRALLTRAQHLTLKRLRAEIAPRAPADYARLLLSVQHVTQRLRGEEGLCEVLVQLEGVSLPLSTWLESVLPSRLEDFSARDLESLCAARDVLWQASGKQRSDVRIAFYLPDSFASLARAPEAVTTELAAQVRQQLQGGAGLFFPDLAASVGGFPPDLLRTLWDMMLAGELTNDTLRPLVSASTAATAPRARTGAGAPTRRQRLPGSEGRWALLPTGRAASEEARRSAEVNLLLRRCGVLSREAIQRAEVSGGFQALYPVLSALEARGRVRRGYFVAGQGPNQFALPEVAERLRAPITPDSSEHVCWLSAADPASAYGLALPWPEGMRGRPSRSPEAWVALHSGELLAFASPNGRGLLLAVKGEPEQTQRQLDALLLSLPEQARRWGSHAWLLESIDERPAADALPHAGALMDAQSPGSPEVAALFQDRLQGAPHVSVRSDGLLIRHASALGTRQVRPASPGGKSE